jgi:uncharacterized OB-fold protein
MTPLGERLFLTISGEVVGPYDVCPGASTFWAGVAEHKVLIHQCANCGRYSHPRQDACENCFGANLTWKSVSGEGTIYSFSTVYRAPRQRPTPYCVGLIRLVEDVYLFAGIEPVERVSIGAPVAPIFAEGSTRTLLNFQIADGHPG